ncbi:BON domain-containing protein [Rickettsiales endosymbiont of Paramecium tredecaurelia]|nr:BON domain-containing protein [Candidatus Sarmatiella mevalonica]
MVLTCLSGCSKPIAYTINTVKTIPHITHDKGIKKVWQDVEIASGIKAQFMHKHRFKRLYLNIDVEVTEGAVFLVGKLKNEEDILEAVQIAWDVPGVQSVTNNLTLDTKDSVDVSQYMQDLLITSTLRCKILLEAKIKSSNYTVITVDGVVYLFGAAKNSDEIEKVNELAAVTNGVTKVVSYVKLQSESYQESGGVYDQDISEIKKMSIRKNKNGWKYK